jgi:hypothetical protein
MVAIIAAFFSNRVAINYIIPSRTGGFKKSLPPVKHIKLVRNFTDYTLNIVIHGPKSAIIKSLAIC